MAGKVSSTLNSPPLVNNDLNNQVYTNGEVKRKVEILRRLSKNEKPTQTRVALEKLISAYRPELLPQNHP